MQRLLPTALAVLMVTAAAPAMAQVTGPAGGMSSAPASSAPASSAPAQVASVQPAQNVPPTDEAGTPFTNALNLLEAQGYTGITDFRAEGQQFTATAMHDGQRVSVLVDPTTQRIQQRS